MRHFLVLVVLFLTGCGSDSFSVNEGLGGLGGQTMVSEGIENHVELGGAPPSIPEGEPKEPEETEELVETETPEEPDEQPILWMPPAQMYIPKLGERVEAPLGGRYFSITEGMKNVIIERKPRDREIVIDGTKVAGDGWFTVDGKNHVLHVGPGEAPYAFKFY